MKKLLILAAFLCSFLAINNYNISVPFDGTEDPLTGAFNRYYSPTYSLGVLSKGYSLSIKLAMKNQNSQDLSALTVSLYQLTGSNPLAYTKNSLTTVKNTATLIQYSYDITFSGTAKTASFELEAVSDTFTDFNFFSIDVVYYNTSQGATSKKAKTILRVTQTQRHSIMRMIFVASPTILGMTLFPATTTLNNFQAKITPIMKSDWTRSNGWRLESQPLPTTSTFNDVLKIESITTGKIINRGYYLLQVTFSSTKPKDFAKITFQTDPYKCPFDILHADYYHSFQGCTQRPGELNDGSACIEYNDITGECLECLHGYALVNSRCLANTTCPDRKYFHFGECLDVSSTCDKYDLFTGACLTCIDPAQYVLSFGKCLPKPSIVCKERQYLFNQTCFNVSSTCATFQFDSGKCLSCLNQYQLNSDGTCTPAEVTCPQGQIPVKGNCITIQSQCLLFDELLGTCKVCIRGYFIQNGTCEQVICPSGQVPSKFGTCVDVSVLCTRYDNITGDCLSCQRSYVLRQGKCLQAVSPLAGCREREHLGFGKCANTSTNCKVYDLKKGNCEECENEHYRDYMGRCIPKELCGDGLFSINGQCLSLPRNCLKLDDDKKCIKCSEQYRLVGEQCIYFRSCKPHEFQNSAGECVDVTPGCASWNPSNGECIICMGGIEPLNGVCCPPGQQDCIPLRPSRANSACELQHHSLKICLRCSHGKNPDYSIPYGCLNN